MTEQPQPQLVSVDPVALRALGSHVLRTELPGWTDLDGDPGAALLTVCAEMAARLAGQINELPDLLRVYCAGQLTPYTAPDPAPTVDLAFETTDPVTTALMVPAGTQVSTQAAGVANRVIFTTAEDAAPQPASLVQLLGPGSTETPFTFYATSASHIFLGSVLETGWDAGGPRIVLGLPPLTGRQLLRVELTWEVAAPSLDWELWTGDAWCACRIVGVTAPGPGRQVFTLALPSAGVAREMRTQAGVTHADTCLGMRQAAPGAGSWLASAHVSGIGAVVRADQGVRVYDEALGTGTGTPGQRFPTARPITGGPDAGAHMVLSQGPGAPALAWTQVTSFADSTAADRHFAIDAAGGAVVFGPSVTVDGTPRQYGAIPPSGAALSIVEYRTGGGPSTPVPGPGTIRQLPTGLPFPGTVRNLDAPVTALPTASHAPLALEFPDRVITRADVEREAVRDEGIARAEVTVTVHDKPISPYLRPARYQSPPVPAQSATAQIELTLAATTRFADLPDLPAGSLMTTKDSGVPFRLDEAPVFARPATVAGTKGVGPWSAPGPAAPGDVCDSFTLTCSQSLPPLSGLVIELLGTDGNAWKMPKGTLWGTGPIGGTTLTPAAGAPAGQLRFITDQKTSAPVSEIHAIITGGKPLICPASALVSPTTVTVGATQIGPAADSALTLGTTTTAADQIFPFKSPVVGTPPSVLVGTGTDFTPWPAVGSFTDSGPDQRAVVVDVPAQQVAFSPEAGGTSDRHGALPAAGSTVKLTAYTTTLGAGGNLSDRPLTLPAPMSSSTAVTAQLRDASGGEDGTPAVRQPVPLTVANTVYIDVVPALSADAPLTYAALSLSDELLSALAERIEALAPPGVVIHPGPPPYQGVAITTTVRAQPTADPDTVRAAVEAAVAGSLHPLTGGPEGTGRPAGTPVVLSDLFRVVSDVPEVAEVVGITGEPTDPATGTSTGSDVVSSRITVRERALVLLTSCQVTVV
ncbi:baseplate J/gp47 family protein [Streptomyces yaizuensis]|uniref:Baseplate assembly protein n=1 Tax=Streptomyces yaizuensis TaxID=2989713 RepID=A0ABQ5NY20_9ACTN|nr:hypothetical protein [Streptomyces sp. YSPA8]GLF95269.1 hypothetical protein SYYSPA8_13250 [Streptomyces sp. YSPA8]